MRDCPYNNKKCTTDTPCRVCWVKINHVENKKKSSPLLDQLESGPWPQFINDMKKKSRR